jgi:serine protease Do
MHPLEGGKMSANMPTTGQIRILLILSLAALFVLAGCSMPFTGDDNDDVNDNSVAVVDDDTETDRQPFEPIDNDGRSPIERAVEEVRPAVAFLAVQVQPAGVIGQPQEGVGSGVIFDEEGFILTNDHVIQDATEISVVLPDGRTFEGTVIGRSPERDLAIVEIDTDDELPVARLGDMDDVRVGQTVVAIGNALGLPGGPTVTSGVVSALGRTIPAGQGQPPMENLIQTDAAINLGNSGGPLIDLDGNVIGINTARIRQAEGIGFAVSVDTARRFIAQVIEGEPQTFIGISGTDVSPALAEQFGLPAEHGIIIMEVTPNSPAQEAGLQPGDILIGIDDMDIETVQELQSALQDYEPGDNVVLHINREGTELEVELILGESPIVR